MSWVFAADSSPVQAARQRRRSLPASSSDQSNGTAPTAVAAAATAADQLGSGGKSTVKKNWLKHRLFNMSKGSLKNLEDDESDATSRASSAADLQVTYTRTPRPAVQGLTVWSPHSGDFIDFFLREGEPKGSLSLCAHQNSRIWLSWQPSATCDHA